VSTSRSCSAADEHRLGLDTRERAERAARCEQIVVGALDDDAPLLEDEDGRLAVERPRAGDTLPLPSQVPHAPLNEEREVEGKCVSRGARRGLDYIDSHA
jgi:hypothetical protein